MEQRIILAFLSMMFLAGCTTPGCNSPYIQTDKGCCPDRNNNSICDADDAATTAPDAAESMCSGELVVVYADKIWLYTGESTRITASFRNNGNASSLPATLRIRSVAGNSTNILLERNVTAEPGETVNVTAEAVPAMPGRYMIIGTAEYCGRTTWEKSTILNVRNMENLSDNMPAVNGREKEADN